MIEEEEDSEETEETLEEAIEQEEETMMVKISEVKGKMAAMVEGPMACLRRQMSDLGRDLFVAAQTASAADAAQRAARTAAELVEVAEALAQNAERERRARWRAAGWCHECGSRRVGCRGSNGYVSKRRCKECGFFWEFRP